MFQLPTVLGISRKGEIRYVNMLSAPLKSNRTKFSIALSGFVFKEEVEIRDDRICFPTHNELTCSLGHVTFISHGLSYLPQTCMFLLLCTCFSTSVHQI